MPDHRSPLHLASLQTSRLACLWPFRFCRRETDNHPRQTFDFFYQTVGLCVAFYTLSVLCNRGPSLKVHHGQCLTSSMTAIRKSAKVSSTLFLPGVRATTYLRKPRKHTRVDNYPGILGEKGFGLVQKCTYIPL